MRELGIYRSMPERFPIQNNYLCQEIYFACCVPTTRRFFMVGDLMADVMRVQVHQWPCALVNRQV